MSGGYFDRNIYAIGEIAASIERDIARALRPKPEKVHEDYWTIYEHDSPCSWCISSTDSSRYMATHWD